MSDTNTTGYVEAAEILETRQEKYDEAESLTSVVPDGFRVVEVSNGEGYKIESETTYAGRWIPVARFTEPDAKYEWADKIQKESSDEYRCVVDRTEGEVWLEVWTDDD